MGEPLELLAPRPLDLDDARLGVLDSGEDGSAALLESLIARLKRRHFLSEVVHLAKPSAGQPCAVDLLAQMAERCEVMILGVARSGEAAVALAADATVLESRHVPCAVLAWPRACAATHGSSIAGRPFEDSAIELGEGPHEDPTVLQKLVEDSFRRVEQALMRPDSTDPAAQPPATIARNGEVSCEC